MKKLVLTLLLGSLMLPTVMLSGGCARGLDRDFGATPALTSRERYQQIGRNWDYEGKQIMDDIDEVFLLRPASRLTIWNVQ
jgi:hypothetical protein